MFTDKKSNCSAIQNKGQVWLFGGQQFQKVIFHHSIHWSVKLSSTMLPTHGWIVMMQNLVFENHKIEKVSIYRKIIKTNFKNNGENIGDISLQM